MTYQQPSTSGISPPIEKSSRKSDLSFAKVSAAALAAIQPRFSAGPLVSPEPS
jgi:hypothetical protein